MGDRVLVIVESAAKAKTISKFLGRNYKVLASVGHVRDLPKSKLGVDVEHGFTPQYVTIRGKGEILKHIREESEKSSRVLLATDPDREGEAIAWHLSQAMNLKDNNPCRIEFNEITKDAVTRAVKKPRPIDMNRVNAQQARRVLDRLVGYSLSPLLWNKIKKGLSAGRVQSVALRLICEREREIESFVPEEYWTIEGEFAAGNKALVARLVARGREKLEIGSREAVDAILRELETARFTVSKVEKKTKKRNPVPPFITSSLQQEAYKKLGFTANKTMRVAQELYEGLSLGEGGTVGLVTYIRTDSSRVAEEAQREALDFVEQTFGKEYRPEKPNVYKSKKTAQDAHEAIRPTSVWRQPERVKTFLTRDQYRLYKLIWERFLASQMAPAVYDTVTVEITGGGYVFRASASNLKFPGYLAVYQESENEEEDEKRTIPEVQEGQELVARGFKPEQHFTQPPPRYTEASLVKMLEEKNIGRPSTYAPIVDTILRRGYVERKNKQFVPTELGFIVVDLLKDYFPEIMDVEFTASMEENLDRIEEGELNWQETVEEFYVPFSDKLRKASSEIEKVELKPEEAGKDCPVCGKPMVIRNGRYGRFLACSGFPKCRYTESVNEETGITCPQCGRKVIALRTKKGRRFYGCEGYPQCDFRSWNLPTEKKCPQCGEPMVRKRGRGQEYLACTSKECRYEEKEARM
ncbi:type I DNA topoisomerase [Syntrophothermus sp.]|uniref:type I DNA topoisomerase n=1 Tax=Syntrophothermus sp. TaxID=2736299 RepID=UPI0025802839|nr:type I DNA topoisomerase [Syntrophothermus sp.]